MQKLDFWISDRKGCVIVTEKGVCFMVGLDLLLAPPAFATTFLPPDFQARGSGRQSTESSMSHFWDVRLSLYPQHMDFSSFRTLTFLILDLGSVF